MQEKRWSRHRAMLDRNCNPMAELSIGDKQDIEKMARSISSGYVASLKYLKNNRQRQYLRERVRALIEERLAEGQKNAGSSGYSNTGK